MADRLDDLRRQGFTYNAAYVIGLENFLRGVHVLTPDGGESGYFTCAPVTLFETLYNDALARYPGHPEEQ